MAKSKEEKHSQEFLERRELQDKDIENIKVKHKLKMEALAFERETNRLFHEWALERGRINRAEERKLFYEKRSYRK